MRDTTIGIAPRPSRLSRLFINRDFAVLWIGGTLSVLGDFILETTLIVWIASQLAAGRAWAPLAVSGLLVASAVPVLLVGPLAGVLVDRWPKRRTLVRANAASALLVLALLPATGSLPFQSAESLPVGWRLGVIYAIVFLASASAQFLRPAGLVLLGDVVPEEHRARAVSLNQASASLAILLGPPLAAPLLFAAGAHWALVIDAATFVAALLAVLAVRTASPDPEPDASPPGVGHVLRELRAGLGFFVRSHVLTTLAVSLRALMLGAGALNALDIFFVSENLRAPTSMYGWLGAAQGAGMVLGALGAGLLASRLGLERLVWGTLVALGALTLVYSRLTSFAPGVAVTFLIGLVIPAPTWRSGP